MAAVIVLVGNKSDLVENRAISVQEGEELASQYAQILECIVMACLGNVAPADDRSICFVPP